jgi:hypothetical protein
MGLPYHTSTNRLYNYHLIARVRARILPALEFHHRLSHLELVLFRDSRPLAFSKMGSLIALSTGLLATVADDQELIAVVAHELGHMYVINDFTQALVKCDFERLRKLELYCDSIAVATLINLHMNPSSLTNILIKLYHHPRLAPLVRRDPFHPSLAARLNVINAFSSSLKSEEGVEREKAQSPLWTAPKMSYLLPPPPPPPPPPPASLTLKSNVLVTPRYGARSGK